MIAQCRICGSEWASWDDLQAHERQAHPVTISQRLSESATNTAQCNRCGEWVSAAAWAGHAQLHVQEDRERARERAVEAWQDRERESVAVAQITTTNGTTTPIGGLTTGNPRIIVWNDAPPVDAPAPEKKADDTSPITGEKKRRIKRP